MARFQIVGTYNCIEYAKADKIADEIQAVNPAVEFLREPLDEFHWTEFARMVRKERGWNVKGSLVVWELLSDVGGKGHLIGGINEFCEFSALYFDVHYNPEKSELLQLVEANIAQYMRNTERIDNKETSYMNIAIVNPPIKMLELFLVGLLSPVSMFPKGLLVNVQIFDRHSDSRQLAGLVMEITDLASPFLHKDYSRMKGETAEGWINRIELLAVDVFQAFPGAQCHNCNICICGDGPQCYIAEIARKLIPYDLCPEGRLIAIGQYVLNQAKAELERIGQVRSGCIGNLHGWGWPGMVGAYVEVTNAVVRGADVAVQGPGVEVPLGEQVLNPQYIFTKFSDDFLKVQQCILEGILKKPNVNMCLVEATLATFHIWLISHPTWNPSRVAPKFPYPCSKIPVSEVYPSIAIGIPVSENSSFTKGTYMVQPSVCMDGAWRAVGKISEKTHAKVTSYLEQLWPMRENIIYKDKNVELSDLFIDLDTTPCIPISTLKKMLREGRLVEPPSSSMKEWPEEIPGEFSTFDGPDGALENTGVEMTTFSYYTGLEKIDEEDENSSKMSEDISFSSDRKMEFNEERRSNAMKPEDEELP